MADPQRRPNFSEEEIAAIVSSFNARAHILLPKHRGDGSSDNSITNAMKSKAWREITDAVNAVGGKDRTIQEVKRKHKNYKSKTRAINAENMREMKGTGGGTAFVKPLNATQVMVLETIPKAALIGIDGGIDLHDIKSTSTAQPDEQQSLAHRLTTGKKFYYSS